MSLHLEHRCSELRFLLLCGNVYLCCFRRIPWLWWCHIALVLVDCVLCWPSAVWLSHICQMFPVRDFSVRQAESWATQWSSVTSPLFTSYSCVSGRPECFWGVPEWIRQVCSWQWGSMLDVAGGPPQAFSAGRAVGVRKSM